MEITDITLIAISSILIVSSSAVLLYIKCKASFKPNTEPHDWVLSPQAIKN
jgi:hypothetical protein